MAVQTVSYPVTYTQEMPETLSRWLWLFKWLLLIPHMFVLAFLGIAAWFALVVAWFAILITGRHPRGTWDFLLGINRWSARVNAYSLHMTDIYPPFSMDDDPDHPVRISAEYSDSSNRLTTFFRYFMVIPHWIILGFLGVLFYPLMLVNVLIVIFTGKPHAEVFNLMAGILRWQTRAGMYYQLITDEYPPFSLD